MSPRKKTATTEPTTIDNSVGPISFSRDEHGLLKNVQYIFNDDGSVNWRAMIKNEHLFPNRGWFESRGKDVPNSAQGLKDHQLLIKLSGIKELARLRGFSSLSFWAERCEENHVAITCNMTFIPNYETGDKEITFQDMANATLENTSSFATKFLETIACNRAFVRCVRNFLNVHIVGDDEIDKSDNSPSASKEHLSSALSPHSVLEKKFIVFDELKSKLRELWSANKYKNDDVKKWTDFSDIPPKEARILIGLINSE